MGDLVRWLGMQLDADEQAARKAAALCGCHPAAPSWSFRDGDEPSDGRILVVDDPHPGLKRKIGRRWNTSYEGLFTAEHIVRHDPARVLREIDAKRQLIERYERAMENRRAHPDDLASAGALLALHGAVKLLALPYAEKPGYRAEWRL